MQDPVSKTIVLIWRNLSSYFPPTKLLSLDRQLTLALIADSAIMKRLQAAEKAPSKMKARPSTQPLRLST
jgi:hypothetical protein